MADHNQSTPQEWNSFNLKKTQVANTNNDNIELEQAAFAGLKLKSAPKPADYAGNQANISISPSAPSQQKRFEDDFSQTSPYDSIRNGLKKVA